MPRSATVHHGKSSCGFEPISITISDQVRNSRATGVLLRLKPVGEPPAFRLAGDTDSHGFMIGEILNWRMCEELIRIRVWIVYGIPLSYEIRIVRTSAKQIFNLGNRREALMELDWLSTTARGENRCTGSNVITSQASIIIFWNVDEFVRLRQDLGD